MKIFTIIMILLLGHLSFAQIGIGNTDPQAILDISATSSTSPANNDGILIPRMSNFPSTPGATRDGMLIFYTGASASGKGFYYWNQDTTNWIKIASGNNDDADWHEVGSSTAPNDINDTIYTLGKLNIGSNTVPDGIIQISNTFPIENESLVIENSGSITGSAYSINNRFNIGTGASTNLTGLKNDFNNNQNTLFTVGLENDFNSSNSSNLIGTINSFSANSGVLTRMGTWNQFLGGTTLDNYGVNNTANSGYAMLGTIYGVNNNLEAQGNGDRYGVRNYIESTGNGTKYGVNTFIPNTTGGLHYGTYIDVRKPNGYAGYFIGRLSLGTGDVNRYVMPLTDGSSGQVMATDGSGNVTFQTVAGDGDTQNTLDQAYDEGGAGAGRTITADAGALEIISNTNGSNALRISQNGANNSTSLLIENSAEGTNQGIVVNSSQGNGIMVAGSFIATGALNGSTTTAVKAIATAIADPATGIEAQGSGSINLNYGIKSTAFGGTENWAGYFGDGTFNSGTGNVFVNDDLITEGTFKYRPGGLPVTPGLVLVTAAADGLIDAVDLSTLITSDADWYVENTTNTPSNITDDIYTNGHVGIGVSNVVDPLQVLTLTDDRTASFRNEYDGGSVIGLLNDLDGASTTTNFGFSSGLVNRISRTNQSFITGVSNSFTNSVATNSGGQIQGYSNFFGNSTSNSSTGLINRFQGTTQEAFGVQNFVSGVFTDLKGMSNYNTPADNLPGIFYGLHNTLSGSSTGERYGVYTLFEETGNGLKYGEYIDIPTTAGGIHYGIYADVQKSSGYAAYLLGRTSLGTSTTNRYLMPPTDGTANQVMTTDGSGNVTFQNPNIGNDWTLTGNTGTNAATNFIGTIDNEDLSFRINNREHLRLTNRGQLEVFNTGGGAIFIGEDAGENTNPSAGSNSVFIGKSAGFSNYNGSLNVAIGDRAMYSNEGGLSNIGVGVFALYNNINGNNNLALGFRSGRGVEGSNNTFLGSDAGGVSTLHTKSGSVFIGYQAGYSEVNSNRLYVENSNTSNPLIYGEFDNNILRVNGELQIGNPAGTGYAFSSTDGTANQVLSTNGAGNVSWTTPTNGDITSVNAGTGLTGGGSTGAITLNAIGTNGLTTNPDDIRLGGSLTIPTTIAQGNNDMIFNLNGTGDFRINDNGTSKLVVLDNGDTVLGGDLYMRDEDTGGTVLGRFIDINGDDGALELYDSGTQTTRINGGGDSYLNGGNLGIGTATPDYNLSVSGTLNLREDIAGGGTALRVNGTEALWFDGSSFSWGFGGTSNFFADAVGIGINAPAYKLDVREANAGDYVAQIFNTSTNANADGLKIRVGNLGIPTTSTSYVAFFDGNNTVRGRIQGNGAGVTFNTTSDRRLKTNISDVENALNLINKIQPRRYEYKANLGKQEYGFIAQELQPIYPQAVTGTPDSDVETNPMMVDYSRLTPLLTAGIKELKDEIDQLKSDNEKLKAQLAKYETLEARLSALENGIKKDSEILLVSKN
jgi:hypothetical protein